MSNSLDSFSKDGKEVNFRSYLCTSTGLLRLGLFDHSVLIDAEAADPDVGSLWIKLVVFAKIRQRSYNIANRVATIEA